MSSSKVFREDPLFTPTSLVRRTIAAVRREPEPRTAQAPPSPAHHTGPPAPPEVPPEPQAVPEPAPPIDLEAIRQEAYNQGMSDLAARMQLEFQQTIAAFADACQKIDKQRQTMLRHSRSDLINLIIVLSEKIIGQELATPRNIIAATLRTALEQAIDSEEYYVTLHPDDLALAEAEVPEMIAAIRGLERIVFKTDPGMTRGGCLLESATCTVDASIETRLASMRELLEEQPILPPMGDPDPAMPTDLPPVSPGG